ncbi:beta-lactamase/transpeptidase-like protein [Fistulina hepatica ATCC 64428]|uniref:Beta-lactamase/transpeptidase-like protein n=1 Tax=Fistulina hepatica ATCC 64428 TaxID=1128425 RepID=A0A0D7AHD8_9AGAR|nr:beta-lactamase/transpeptidase-like protein [Fistulina hepatica ATCC 64428]
MRSEKYNQQDGLRLPVPVHIVIEPTPRDSQIYKVIICYLLSVSVPVVALLWCGILQLNLPSILVPAARQVCRNGPSCKVPLPNLPAYHPPSPHVPEIVDAGLALDAYLSARTSESDIDSLFLSVITPHGPVFERGYGVLKANQTSSKTDTVDSDSIYRIASITKMFTVLETLILRERGILNWDDDVKKFLPNLTYHSYGWAEYLSGAASSSSDTQAPITLRQLASHMAGIGRDYPLSKSPDWPEMRPSINAKLDHSIFRPAENYQFPVYSNAGMDVLGLANVAANKLASDGVDQSESHKDLVKRDIFDPLGMTSSFYRVPEDQAIRDLIAIPAVDSDEADLNFGDAMDPSGGQYSSGRDLASIMKTFLSPTAEGGVVSDYVLREWLRPLHPWSDGTQEVGAPWEIRKIGNENRVYSKGGNLRGYHSQFVLNMDHSYGIIVLVTGEYADTVTLSSDAIERFDPVFKGLLEVETLNAYGGLWQSEDSFALIGIEYGVLYLQVLVVRGIDVLAALHNTEDGNGRPMTMWSTGRLGEFRLGVGRPELNDVPLAGCEPYWISIDPNTYSRGAPVDLIYFEDDMLVYPSAGVRLSRA